MILTVSLTVLNNFYFCVHVLNDDNINKYILKISTTNFHMHNIITKLHFQLSDEGLSTSSGFRNSHSYNSPTTMVRLYSKHIPSRIIIINMHIGNAHWMQASNHATV